MLKILIVDDEELIRKGLIKAVGRANHKIDEIKEAANGQDALRIIRTFKPQIVLTDIKMPVMDGLEMVEKAREEALDTTFIIISGYEEFSYAKRAMKYGVETYLLKPIDEDELLESINKYSSNMNQEQINLEKASNYKNAIGFLKNSMYESGLQMDTKKQGKNTITFKHKIFFVAISYLYDMVTHYEGDASIDTIAGIFHKKKMSDDKDYEIYVFENKVAEMVCVINGDGITSGMIKKYLSQISHIVKENMKLDIFFGASNSFFSLEEIHGAYIQAQDAILNRIYESHMRVFLAGEEKHFDEINTIDFEYYKTICLDTLLNMDKEGLFHCLGSLFGKISEKSLRPKDLIELLKKFLSDILNEISTLDGGISNFVDRYIGRLNLIVRYNSLDAIKKFYYQVFTEVYNGLLNSQEDDSRKIIQVAKAYIHNQCFDKITLDTISRKLQMSSAYLSHLFKKETGYNFIDYVTEIKMKKAKELLITSPDMKIYEIAFKLGYNDVKYFNRVFKKIFSKTPGECRDSNKRE